MAKDINQPLIQKTIRLFSPPNGDPMTEQDALETIQNAVDLYSYLLELKEKYDAQEKNI